jgi:hypothetical protein
MKKKYHVYGQHYNWTHDIKEAKQWAINWNGIVTIEFNGHERPLSSKELLYVACK